MGTSWALGIGTKGVYRVTRVYHQWQRDAAGALEGHSGFHRGIAGVLGLSQGWWWGGGGYIFVHTFTYLYICIHIHMYTYV
jgi:hypothetical protein